jgi:3-methyladenine DNA glycosylase/8-oxoguanine DNA glycosylase
VIADARARFELERPLDLGLTLSLVGSGSWFRRDADGVLRATRTPEGPATIRLTSRGGGVEAEAWGSGARWAVDHAPQMFGADDDDSGFQPAHPLIARLHRETRGMRMPRTLAVFEALVPAIAAQLVTSIEAHRSYRALVAALGEPAPGPLGLTLPPSPRVLATTPYWAYHRFGIERRRAETIIRAARSAKRLEETTAMNFASARDRLLAFPGVGAWTAAKVAMVALGDPDAVPVGDYHLPHSVGYAFEGTARSSDERMLELLEPYRGHRARVVRMITMAGISAPKFGPHRPLRDIARN